MNVERKVTIMISLLMIVSMAVLVGCSGNEKQDDEPIRATWIRAEIAADKVTISLREVKNNRMSHFEIGTSAGDITFMAYELVGNIYVRANICPPCRSESFSLYKETLVCDTCATVFDAKTGNGIRGACMAFPKALVRYEVTNGKMVMKEDDLIIAYRDTLQPGQP